MLNSSLRRAQTSPLGPTFTCMRRRVLFHARGCDTSNAKRNCINSILVHRISIHGKIIGFAPVPPRTLTTTTCAIRLDPQHVNDTAASTLEETATTTFSSHSMANPHLLLTPKEFLIRVFEINGVHNTGESFHVISVKQRRKTWYTATFTDPVTKEVFPSGLERRTFLGKKSHADRMRAMDGKVYCLNATLAEHAAAARAIDCYIFREGTSGTNAAEAQLCLESPYNQTIDDDGNNNNKNINNDNTTSHNMNKLQISKIVTFLPQLLMTPCRLLHTIFALKNHDSIKNMKTNRRIHHDGQTWFTATFTDPITDETFTSGLVVTEVNVRETDTSLPLHRARTMHVDGIVYYGERSLAQQAAAARAIDCYVYREQTTLGSTANDEIRLCIEPPYSLSADDESPPIDYDAIICRRNTNFARRDEDIFKKESSDGANVEEDVQKIDINAASAIHNGIYELETDDDANSAMTLSSAEPITEVRKLQNLSTMGRIFEIWTDTADIDTFDDNDVPKESKLHSEYDSPRANVKSILDWYARVVSGSRTKSELSALTCIKLLASLGKANMEQSATDDGSQVSIETDAKKILGRIISLAHPSKRLDADTFNSYLCCLDRCDPERSAVYAEELLQCMREQSKHERMKGISLPLPNVETYNTVMNLWALVDGPDGRHGVNRVYSLLEAATLEGDEFSPHPNITTFKTIIAANSRQDGKFSFEQAKLWLIKMKEISESICSEAFTPDADIFTSALRVQSMKRDVRETDSSSWMSYGDPYAGGFKSVDDQAKGEATDIAQWLLYAEELGVHPNIEMYEAVIRAWTKTGTRDGLIMAEDWAKRAVSSGAPTRLETFHPIIAAWALCQFDRAPARVQEWIHQLTGLSDTMPHLKPDLSILSAHIIAWKNVQAGIIAKSNQTKKSSSSSSDGRLNGISLDSSHQTNIDGRKAPQDVDMVFVAVQNCMEQLQTVLSTGSSHSASPQDAVALNSMVCNTIQTWGCASRFALFHTSTTSSASLDTSHGVHEMLTVAKLVKAKTDFDDDTHNGSVDNDERAYFNLQLLGQGYTEIISQLHQVDSALDSTTTTTEGNDTSVSSSYFSREIAHVERMLNEFDLYSRKISPQGTYTAESMALRHRLYREILIGCAKLTSPSDYGHAMRLCKLIMDQLLQQEANTACYEVGRNTTGRNHNNHHGRNYHHDRPIITDIFVDMAHLTGSIVPIPQERTYVLTTLWQSAKPFIRRKTGRSNHATVHPARLISAMRNAMGDWEGTESFIRHFDEWRCLPTRRRVRGNTWLAYVQDLLKKTA